MAHNNLLWEPLQKSVLELPFRVRPKPPWFVDHRNLAAMGRALVMFEIQARRRSDAAGARRRPPGLSYARAVLRLGFASALICSSIALTGCTAVLPGWHVSASRAGCEQHLGFVITDAEGDLREVEHPREVIPNYPKTNDLGAGTMQITRGEGGWWIANKGVLRPEYGQSGGALAWLADGSNRFEVVATGRYVGVVTHAGQTWAVRGECPFSYGHSMQTSYAVLERITPTASGWAAPVEVQRFADLCPTHALADRDGRPLVVGIDTAVYKDELFRNRGRPAAFARGHRGRVVLGPRQSSRADACGRHPDLVGLVELGSRASR